MRRINFSAPLALLQVLITAFLVLFSSQADAYNNIFFGGRLGRPGVENSVAWNKGPSGGTITWYLERDQLTHAQCDDACLTGLEALVHEELEKWAYWIDLSFAKAPTAAEAEVLIHFNTKLSSGASISSAAASPLQTLDGILLQAEVVINPDSFNNTINLAIANFKYVLLHEFGHVLGLGDLKSLSHGTCGTFGGEDFVDHGLGQANPPSTLGLEDNIMHGGNGARAPDNDEIYGAQWLWGARNGQSIVSGKLKPFEVNCGANRADYHHGANVWHYRGTAVSYSEPPVVTIFAPGITAAKSVGPGVWTPAIYADRVEFTGPIGNWNFEFELESFAAETLVDARIDGSTVADFTASPLNTGPQIYPFPKIFGPSATPCVFSISKTNQSFTSTGGTGSLTVTDTAGCGWTAISDSDWLKVTSGARARGYGSVGFSVAANTGLARTGTIKVAGHTFTVTQAAAACPVSITPTAQSFPYAGGSGSVAVATPAGCYWRALSSAAWLKVTSGASGTGSGTAGYTVDYNPGPEKRTATINVNGLILNVTQLPPSYGVTISPLEQSFGPLGGTGRVDVTRSALASTSYSPWITITAGASDSSNGFVEYTVDANTGFFPRAGIMSVATVLFKVTQEGSYCPPRAVTPFASSFTSAGGTGSISVGAQAGCGWTAVSYVPWITVTTGPAGIGDGMVEYSISANNGAAFRAGVINVAGINFMVTQKGTAAGIENKFVTVEAGNYHNLALKDDGTLWAWGYNYYGQLGDGTTISKKIPVQVGVENTWASIAAGSFHSLALKSDGTLWAWGDNAYGQLGDGTTTQSNIPVQVGIENIWVSIAAGNYHNLALKSDGTLWVWGLNGGGQLGDGTTVDKNSPVQVGSENTWVSIAAGLTHTLALKSDGTLWAWGWNANGQLGDGTTVYKNIPVQVGVENTWASIAAGNNHNLALKSNGTLWAWGANANGQLGDGTTVSKNIPVQVDVENTWASIAAGNNHNLALKSNGTLWAWGANANGQLGDGTTTQKITPVQVGNDNKWTILSAGFAHSIALKSDGTLWAWGDNAYGQLGDGTGVNRSVPGRSVYFTITAGSSGTGSGTVNISPAGIDCSSPCLAQFNTASQVTLMASPAADSYFAGWVGGGCSGTGSCTVAMLEDRWVSAEFTKNPALTVNKSGTGTGFVQSTPAGIDCGSGCSAVFEKGASVTLKAFAAPSSEFIGWSGGGCAGTGDCTVTMNADAAVTAEFTLDTTPPSITVNPVASPVTAESVTLTGTVEEGSTVAVATGTAASDGPAVVTGGTWSYTITGLAAGDNDVVVTATDQAGNTALLELTITRSAAELQQIDPLSIYLFFRMINGR